MAHITEEAFFPNTTEWTPAKVIKAAASSIQTDPLTFIVRESTPNGRENEFHDAWVKANSFDKDGKRMSAFTPFFVAWFEIEKYTLPFKSEDEKANFAIWLWENREDEQFHGKYFWWLFDIKGATLEGKKCDNSLSSAKIKYLGAPNTYFHLSFSPVMTF